MFSPSQSYAAPFVWSVLLSTGIKAALTGQKPLLYLSLLAPHPLVNMLGLLQPLGLLKLLVDVYICSARH